MMFNKGLPWGSPSLRTNILKMPPQWRSQSFDIAEILEVFEIGGHSYPFLVSLALAVLLYHNLSNRRDKP